MATIISMPKLSDTMEEGIILKWLKNEGDTVKQGEVLAEVQTDKAEMELEAYDSGIIRKIFVTEGKGAAIGKPIAIIAGADEDITSMLQEKPSPSATAHHHEDVMVKPPTVASASADSKKESGLMTSSKEHRLKASPLAKRIAEEHEINISALEGSGPQGRIIKRDVEKFVNVGKSDLSHKGEAGIDQDIPLTLMRKTIAKRLVESKSTIPHFYLTIEVNMEQAKQFRESINKVHEEKISFNDIIIKACALALKRNPAVNASFAGDKIVRHGNVHIGVAVAVDEGLITPVVRFTDQKGIAEIAAESKEYSARARERKLKPEEFSGGTFTVSNLGMFGIDEFSAIINPPEGAILAIGAIAPKAIVIDGQITAASVMKLTMSCDHRVIDGAAGANFLADLKQILEHPAALAL